MSGGQNNSRLTSITYPNGKVLNYNYDTGLDSTISRLSSLSDKLGNSGKLLVPRAGDARQARPSPAQRRSDLHHRRRLRRRWRKPRLYAQLTFLYIHEALNLISQSRRTRPKLLFAGPERRCRANRWHRLFLQK